MGFLSSARREFNCHSRGASIIDGAAVAGNGILFVGPRRRSGGKMLKANPTAVFCSAVLLAGALTAAGEAVGGTSAAYIQLVAADEPQLPAAPEPIGPLRRGQDNKIELITPGTEQGNGRTLCLAGALCVGPTQPLRTLVAALAVARDGDVIEIIGGTYRGSAKITRANVTVRGIAGRPHIDCTGLTLSEEKACVLLAGNGIVIENLEISGALVPESEAACVRNELNRSYTLRGVICHDSQRGVVSNGGDILIENSEFYDNRADNAYLGGGCSVTVRGSSFRDAKTGDEFKSRCTKTMILDSTFRSARGSHDIDIPDGGETTIYRSTLVKLPGTAGETILAFTSDSCAHPGAMLLKQVHITSTDPSAIIQNFNKCPNAPLIFQGVIFDALRPKLVGYIVMQ